MIRPAGGSWPRWALNVAMLAVGAAGNVVASTVEALRRR